VAAVVAVLMLPGVTEWMVYQRSAVARGELWRLFTAHLAHYSVSHLLNNVLVLALAGWLVEARYRTQWLSLVTVSAAGIGFAVFAFEPQIERFAGASGISLALLTYAARW
jgi:rhomboid family GlyGly-CTERM serine protease